MKVKKKIPMVSRNSKTKRCNKDKRTITVRSKNKDPLTSFLSPLGRGRKKKKMPSSPLKTGVKRRKIRDEHSEK